MTGDWSIPKNSKVSHEAEHFIGKLLHLRPEKRPVIEEITNLAFLCKNKIPQILDISCLTEAPTADTFDGELDIYFKKKTPKNFKSQ